MHPSSFFLQIFPRILWAKLTAAQLCLMAFVLIASFGAPSAHAQSRGPESAIVDQYSFRFKGNYCVAYGGVSLMPNENNTMIDLYVNGTPVQSYWIWSGRDPKASAAMDNTIVAKRLGSNDAITIQATISEKLDNGAYTYFTYLNDTDPVPIQFGENKIAMSGNGHTDAHGAGLWVVYESADRCPYGEQKLYFGADTFTFLRPNPPTGPDSEVACIDFDKPAAAPDIRRYTLYVTAVASTERGNSIWWQTGSGAKPVYLAPDPVTNVSQPDVNEIYDPFNLQPGREFDIYTAEFQVQTGDTWACMQIESPDDEIGISANWVGLIYSEHRPQGSIGDTVWYDHNANGYVEDGEAGIPGVRLILVDATGKEISRTTTNEDGWYTFAHLDLAVYTVKIDESTLPSGVIPTYELDYALDGLLDGSTTVDLLDHKCHPATDVDFGYRLMGTIGDRVWSDVNSNGVQETGETGIPGVTVELIQRETQAVIATQETVDDGFYTFTDVARGNYIVRVDTSTLPAGYYQSGDADQVLDNQSETYLPGGGHIETMDFGYANRASLGDRVWHDLNANGVQDSGEPGIGSVQVTLYTESGSQLAETSTHASGLYQFTNLDAGSYIVAFSAPPGYFYSTPDQGINDATDSDANAATGRAALVTLAAGEANMTVDAGLYQLACIGDTVWEDINNNGFQDEGEPGIGVMPVTLYDDAGNVLETTQTDANGVYEFCELMPGDYAVGFELPTLSHKFSPRDVGSDDSADSDADQQSGRTEPFELKSGENAQQWDAGIYAPPVLNVSKSIQSNLAFPNAVLVYTIDYSNSGMGVATDVIVTETVPEFTTFIPEESSAGWQCDDNHTSAGTVCRYPVGTIAAGAGKSDLLFSVRLDAILPATDIRINNRVEIGGSDKPGGPAGQNAFELITPVGTPQALKENVEPPRDIISGRTIFLPVTRAAQ